MIFWIIVPCNLAMVQQPRRLQCEHFHCVSPAIFLTCMILTGALKGCEHAKKRTCSETEKSVGLGVGRESTEKFPWIFCAPPLIYQISEKCVVGVNNRNLCEDRSLLGCYAM